MLHNARPWIARRLKKMERIYYSAEVERLVSRAQDIRIVWPVPIATSSKIKTNTHGCQPARS